MITNLKDLEKLLKLCRKQGVLEIDLGSVKLKLGNLPQAVESVGEQDEIESDNPYANFPSGPLSPEQLMFYSSGGKPGEEPEDLR